MGNYRIISADSHVNEPAELFRERLPAQYRRRAPHVEVIDGEEYRVQEGTRPRKMPRGRISLEGEDLERSHAGGWDPVARAKDQERDGVAGEVIYGVTTQAAFVTPDQELAMAMARVYNDWLMEIFGEYPDRFAPAAAIPMLDVEAACVEAYRAAKMGFRALFLPAQVPSRPYNDPAYDPFWAVAQEVGLPLNFHCSTGHEPRGERGLGGAVINYVLHAQGDGPHLVTYLCASGVLQRFPNLQVVAVETGSAWLGWILTSMDEIYHKHHMWVRPKLEMLPSEYFKRQGHVTFQNDPVGVYNRSFTGVETLLWGNDYPHHEGTWPHSQEAIQEQFTGVPDEETRRIVGETAARLYKF